MSHGKIYTILFMVCLSVVFTAMVSGLSILSQPAIERNRKLLTQRAFVSVFGLGDVDQLSNDELFNLVEKRIDVPDDDAPLVDPLTGTRFRVLRAYEDETRQSLIAIGFNFRGLGFWAPIEGWLALTPDLAETVGLVITEQRETPGLGGRIEEPIFTEPFANGVRVDRPDGERTKRLVIDSSQPPAGSEQAARHVDAITGATQTGLAMEKILNQALDAFERAWDAREE